MGTQLDLVQPGVGVWKGTAQGLAGLRAGSHFVGPL